MSYKKQENIPKAERARHRYQQVANTTVDRYAWSPYTAKSDKEYTFYADVTLKKAITSPPSVETKNITVRVIRGTFLEFRLYVDSGEAEKRINEIVWGYGGELQSIDGYWRSTNGANKSKVEPLED